MMERCICGHSFTMHGQMGYRPRCLAEIWEEGVYSLCGCQGYKPESLATEEQRMVGDYF